jgi:hypothetical protein
MKLDNVIKHKIIEVEGTIVPSVSYDGYKPHIDYHIYCDTEGVVYEVDCIDYATKYVSDTIIHKPINRDADIINMVVLNDDIIRCGNTHYTIVLEAIQGLNKLLNRNINLKDKLTQTGYKYGFSTKYKIIDTL